MTLSTHETRDDNTTIMLRRFLFFCYVYCRYAECRYSERRYPECRDAGLNW
jgi:hypothetical protein